MLVTGGYGSSGYLARAEVYDGDGTWTVTGSMTQTRYYHTATLLPEGKVLVTGGFNGLSPLSSAEVYDPSTGTWTATGSMIEFRGSMPLLLPKGKVLVTGGANDFHSALLPARRCMTRLREPGPPPPR